MFQARRTDSGIGAEPENIMKTFVAAYSVTSVFLFFVIFLAI
jgi:hypothetical protein